MGGRELTLPAPVEDDLHERRTAVPAERAADLAYYATGVTLDELPGRDLTQAELEELVAGIATDRGRWAEHVAFDDDERVYVSLHRDGHVDVWLLCWTPKSDTGWHDHDISCGAVAVVEGELVENNLTLRDGSRETRVGAGKVYSFGGDHIHRLTGAADRSVSVHAYSPPPWRMSQYADELRPID